MDVYALGRKHSQRLCSRLYTYQEPPKQPAKQTFYGMARWDGTSFSAPLVAGLIADEMARSGVSAQAASEGSAYAGPQHRQFPASARLCSRPTMAGSIPAWAARCQRSAPRPGITAELRVLRLLSAWPRLGPIWLLAGDGIADGIGEYIDD